MLTEERQQHILTLLRQNGKVLASELSRQLDVSEDTVRRDLRKLADAGLLQRVHGGALPSSPASTTFAVRQQQSIPAKQSIARAAVKLIQNGQVVILDGGTTIQQIAQNLPPALRVTVLTHSPLVACALANYPLIEVIVIGGRLDKESLVSVGAATVAAYQGIRADLCMLGICSVHPDLGISIPELEETHVKQAIIASSAEVVALASAEKLGTAATYTVAPLTEVTHLVTESGVPAETLAPYRALGITIVQG